eukprot:724286-Rhodomonas_salina.3
MEKTVNAVQTVPETRFKAFDFAAHASTCQRREAPRLAARRSIAGTVQALAEYQGTVLVAQVQSWAHSRPTSVPDIV